MEVDGICAERGWDPTSRGGPDGTQRGEAGRAGRMGWKGPYDPWNEAKVRVGERNRRVEVSKCAELLRLQYRHMLQNTPSRNVARMHEAKVEGAETGRGVTKLRSDRPGAG